MRGRDVSNELTLKVKISQVLTIAFLETKSIVNHNSLLAGQNKITRTISLQRNSSYQGQWYLTFNKAGKNGLMKLRSDFRAAVSMKNRLHRESG